MANQAGLDQIRKLEIGMFTRAKFQQGFTLIEILVVLFIIGIICTIGFLNFGDFGASRRTKAAAEQFAQFLHLVQQQAVLETHMYRIQVTKDSYSTFLLTENNTWQAVSTISMLRKHYFPKNISVNLSTSSKNSRSNSGITISPTGRFSPFHMIFQAPHADHATELLIKNDSITIQTI